MKTVYKAVFFVASPLALITACVFLVYIVIDWTPLFDNRPCPLGPLGGVVSSDDAVYVATLYDGRIYKYDLNGNIIRWIDNGGGRLYIREQAGSILVRYSGREWLVQDPEFQVRSKGDVKASIEHSWWGNPLLVVRKGDAKTVTPLQPWYFTLLQPGYPGSWWPCVSICFYAAARESYRRWRGPRKGVACKK